MASRKGSDVMDVTEFSESFRADLDRSAKKLLTFLEANRLEDVLPYPFRYFYPNNCCESVSLILTYLLEEKYRLDNVMIVKGTKRDPYEHHFWVKVGNLYYDLTAHQFAGQEPVIGALAHPLYLDLFPDREIELGRDFVDRAYVLELFRAGVIAF